jgi:hypothetical protein
MPISTSTITAITISDTNSGDTDCTPSCGGLGVVVVGVVILCVCRISTPFTPRFSTDSNSITIPTLAALAAMTLIRSSFRRPSSPPVPLYTTNTVSTD